MFNNIIFVGGIHGVGKSTVCKEICEKFSINHLSASSVLKWEELNEDSRNKKVLDIPFTQDRLITGLKGLIDEKKLYLLDGHFCLFDSNGHVTPVPVKTFEDISPILLIVVTGEPQEIQRRLNERDNKNYEVQDLINMQDYEIRHSELISEKIRVTCLYATIDNTSEIIDVLSKNLK